MAPESPGYGPLLSPLEEDLMEEDQSALESLEKELQSIRMEITVIANKIRMDAEVAKIESEWKFAAMVRVGKMLTTHTVNGWSMFRCLTGCVSSPSQPSH